MTPSDAQASLLQNALREMDWSVRSWPRGSRSRVGQPLVAAGPPFGSEKRPPTLGTDHWVGRKIQAFIDACDLPHEDRFVVYLARTVKDEGRAAVIWAETRMGAEAARLMTSGVWRGAGVPHGDGQPVLLVPGFMAGDGSLALMAQWLRRVGYRPHGSRITTNIACSQQTVRRLERRVIELSERHERPVAVIGHSRGGMIGRVLAVRHPERVSNVVALASPLVASMDDLHPLLRFQIRGLQRVQRAAGGGLIGTGCEQSWEAYKFGLDPIGCCTPFWEDLDADVPDGVSFTSIYSRSDGVLHWRACLDPQARHVEVGSSHCGMAMNAAVYREVAAALAAETAGAHAPVEAPVPLGRAAVAMA